MRAHVSVFVFCECLIDPKHIDSSCNARQIRSGDRERTTNGLPPSLSVSPALRQIRDRGNCGVPSG